MEPFLTIAPYDPSWPAQFERERRRIAAAFRSRAVRIEHTGSTAVPGLAAKPIIDIQISVQPLHPLEKHIDRLKTLDYAHVPHADDAFCPFFRRPAEGPHTHHIHLVEAGGDEEKRVLAFRDFLREHPNEANEYAELKRRLATLYRVSQSEDYSEAKGDYINAIIRRALAAGYPRDSAA